MANNVCATTFGTCSTTSLNSFSMTSDMRISDRQSDRQFRKNRFPIHPEDQRRRGIPGRARHDACNPTSDATDFTDGAEGRTAVARDLQANPGPARPPHDPETAAADAPAGPRGGWRHRDKTHDAARRRLREGEFCINL
jgi:hypothetical protein